MQRPIAASDRRQSPERRALTDRRSGVFVRGMSPARVVTIDDGLAVTGVPAGDLDRIAADRVRKQSRPLGVRRGRRQPVHVVDRFREDRNAVEWTSEPATASSHVRRTSVVDRGSR